MQLLLVFVVLATFRLAINDSVYSIIYVDVQYCHIVVCSC